ncbi:MAG: hypothetical protein AB7O24_29980 [Kofleriaceae bacterium]
MTRRAATFLATLAGLMVVAAPGDAAPKRFGVMADVGVPDGATVSVVARPLRPLRLHLGVSHNGISPGVRAGATYVPFSSWVTPSLTIDYGHYTEGDANPLARMISGDEAFSSPVLERVGYDYANAHVGIELGRTWMTFYIHAGMSRVMADVHELEAAAAADSDAQTTISFPKDPHLQITTVSARLGWIVYFK